MRSNVDWVEIRTEYISGTASYRELAEKHGVSESSVRQHGARDGWVSARTEQMHKICTVSEQKAVEKAAEELSEVDAAKHRIRLKLIRMAERWIDDQEGKVNDPTDYRKMVQSCIDMGLLGDTTPDELPKLVIEGLPEEYKA